MSKKFFMCKCISASLYLFLIIQEIFLISRLFWMWSSNEWSEMLEVVEIMRWRGGAGGWSCDSLMTSWERCTGSVQSTVYTKPGPNIDLHTLLITWKKLCVRAWGWCWSVAAVRLWVMKSWSWMLVWKWGWLVVWPWAGGGPSVYRRSRLSKSAGPPGLMTDK